MAKLTLFYICDTKYLKKANTHMILNLCLINRQFFPESAETGFAVQRQKLNSKRTKLIWKNAHLKKKNPTITILHVIQWALKRYTQWNYFSPLISRYKMIKIRTCEENFTTVLWNLPAMENIKMQSQRLAMLEYTIYYILSFMITIL